MTDNCTPVATCTPGSSFAVDEVAATAGDDVAATAGDGVAATAGDYVTATAGDAVASDAWPSATANPFCPQPHPRLCLHWFATRSIINNHSAITSEPFGISPQPLPVLYCPQPRVLLQSTTSASSESTHKPTSAVSSDVRGPAPQ